MDGRKAGISTQAELDKIKSLKPSERIDVYNRAVAKPDGKIDFDSIKVPDENMLSPNGKFKDAELETDYEKYVKRKKKERKKPRDRTEWKEARDYWLNDSPMARGNSFNKNQFLKSGTRAMRCI